MKVKKMNEMKRCSKCKRTLDLSKFSVCNSSLDGHQNNCKECSREYSRLKRAKTPEVKEVIPRDHLDSEIELLQIENKRLKVRFDKILFLYLNEAVKYD